VPADSALYAYLHLDQRIVEVEAIDETTSLRDAADVVIVGCDARIARRIEPYPGQVVLAITPYGMSGPWSEMPSSDLVIQAESGGLATRGVPGSPPFMAGGRTNEWIAGAYGAAGALAAWRWVRASERSELVDVSMLEAAHIAGAAYSPLLYRMTGSPQISAAARTVETVEVHRSKDGWVGFTTNSAQQFRDFLVMIDRADLVGDDRFESAGARLERGIEWTAIVEGWTSVHGTAEIVELAGLFRVPCGPVQHAQDVFEFEHFQEREVFRHSPDGRFRYPRRPWLLDGHAPGPARSAVTVPAAEGFSAPSRSWSRSERRALPLEGISVVDLTAWWAGPTATHFLACLGADVVHVESVSRPDGMRMQGGALAALGEWWERGSFFLSANSNKRGLTLDLTREEGLEALGRLVEQADILVENFTPRVLDNLGLSRAQLDQWNPALITVRMPAFGLDGPWRDRPGFAQTMEQMSGLAWLTGFADDQPHNQRGPSDPNGGIHAAFAAMCALEARARDGKGRQIEASFIEVALTVAAEQLVEFSATGSTLERDGNRAPTGAPQGLYACRGWEQWLALSIETDEHWRALRQVMGDPGWAAAPTLREFVGRRAAHDFIDEHVSRWASEQELDQVVVELRANGVPAGRAIDPRLSDHHEQFRARRFFETIEHPVVGAQTFVTLPFRFSSVDRWLRSPAPTLGQHNGEVLATLGYDDEAIARLAATAVIGTVPSGLG
jgi:crotonobetainyl-CoA:carnitine CoA-transferase CaiB-like acyl-CoA transferase